MLNIRSVDRTSVDRLSTTTRTLLVFMLYRLLYRCNSTTRTLLYCCVSIVVSAFGISKLPVQHHGASLFLSQSCCSDAIRGIIVPVRFSLLKYSDIDTYDS